MVVTSRVLNRTLLQRQGLLERVPVPPMQMLDRLVGLQAQDALAPYLSLWSRVADFDPHELSGLLMTRDAVRILLMRGTIHLVTADDAVLLRPLMQGMLDKVTRHSGVSRPAADVPRDALAATTRAALADGPMPFKALGEELARRFPGYPPGALGNTAREMLPLVQVPPRGLWQRSGGVVYETVEGWLRRDLCADPDPRTVVRRYLRAFGPASAADLAAWSRLTGTRDLLESLRGELVTYRDEHGKGLVDLERLPLAEEDAPAPVRLLGRYDNLWLSHADKHRVAEPDNRRRWMGVNGGVRNTVFVDGYLEGLWRIADGRVEVELFRGLTRHEREDLDTEVEAVEAFLAG